MKGNDPPNHGLQSWLRWLQVIVGVGPLVPLLGPPLLGVAFTLIIFVIELGNDPRILLNFRLHHLAEMASGIIWLWSALFGLWALVSAIFLDDKLARSRLYLLTNLLGLLTGLVTAVLWLGEMTVRIPIDRPYAWSVSTLAMLLVGPMIIGILQTIWILREVVNRR